MSESTQLLQQQNGQRVGAKRATFESLVKKKPRRSEFTAVIDPDEGPVSFLFVAITPSEYDQLVTEFPPTEAQKEKDPGANVDGDTFPPALLAEVCRDPKLSREQWLEIWNNPAYNTGERGSLFWEANGLCNRPLDLTPLETG